MVRRWTPLAVAVGFFIFATAIRYYFVDPYALERRNVALDEDVLHSPGSTVLQLAAMEHAQGWSDLVWLSIVQELGQIKSSKVSFDRIQRWAHIALDLDPYYFTVYHASANHLTAWAYRADASDSILEKGRRFYPDRWELPFLMGFNDYFIRGDCIGAIANWKVASKLPNKPRFILSLVGRSMTQCGSAEEALRFLQIQETSLPEGPLLDDVRIRIKLIKSNPILDAYERVCEKYQEETGAIPENGQKALEWALSRGITGLPEPKDFLGKPIEHFDYEASKHRCYARTSHIQRRDDEAREMDLGKDGKAAKTVTATVTSQD